MLAGLNPVVIKKLEVHKLTTPVQLSEIVAEMNSYLCVCVCIRCFHQLAVEGRQAPLPPRIFRIDLKD
jgi:hypothetical protein